MTNSIRPAFIFLLLCLLSTPIIAQESQPLEFPFVEENWTALNNVEFIDYKSTKAVRSSENGFFRVMLNDFEFSTGTIEYDVELLGTGFPGINFRIDADTLNNEIFYLRHFGQPQPLRRTTTQYAAMIDGVNLWDITDEYQAGATLKVGEWNHVKLVVSENQMLVYVNDMETPTMHVPALEGVTDKGRIMLTGNVIYANMVVHPGEVGDLLHAPSSDASVYDPNYLRNWEMSDPIDFPIGRDVMMAIPNNPGVAIDTLLLNNDTNWTGVEAGHRSVVNLTRTHGASNEGRRLIWLKTKIESVADQEKLMQLGFRDEVWVFINGEVLLVDKNYYGSPARKEPLGRMHLDNTSVKIPLREGSNELLLGVTNYFFGWGVTARFEDNGGLKY